jgi:hypothetical protein
LSTTNEFLRIRAAEARREADAATLDNVRDRHLRAAEAWEAMADRGERTVRRRAETEARKAAEHEAAEGASGA